jgi:nucleoside-diphosphate-sugar epimerase
MRITITGGTGFIGRHVAAEAVRRGHQVRVLARPGSHAAAAADGIDVVHQDLRSPAGLAEALRGSAVVVHCAAALGGDRATQEAVTVGGTKNLVGAMDEAGVGRIVGIGTFAVYDTLRIPVGAVLDESSPLEQDLDARAPYVRVKRDQEGIIVAAAAANGGSWTILRPGLVFGPGRTWFHHLGIAGAGNWVCLAPDSLLPLTYVANCAEAIVLAAESGNADGEILNLVDDDLPTRRDYVERLSERTTPRPRVAALPWSLLDRLSRVAASTDRTLFRGHAPIPDLLRPASLHARCKPLRYTNARAKHVLGWQPRIAWRDALDASVRGGEA